MTKLPLAHFQFHPTPSPCLPLFHRRLSAARTPTMSAAGQDYSGGNSSDGVVPPVGGYPIPLSPPYPPLSKDVELSRAMSAATRSSNYTLSDADIVFEDEWMVVVNKPSGVYCESVLASLSSSPSRTTTNQPELHLANRLDRDTSGLMVITKSHKVAGKLVKAFTDRRVKKTYLAQCIGRAPKWERIKVSSGHGRSRFGAWRVYSAMDVGCVLPGGSVVKQMVTSFELLLANGQGKFKEPTDDEMDGVESILVEKWNQKGEDDVEKKDEILVRAYPQSGRTHQIRLHCQYLGFPIKGDVKYGGIHQWKGVPCDIHALHAETLAFQHPMTGVPIQFRAPLPSWASKLCQMT